MQKYAARLFCFGMGFEKRIGKTFFATTTMKKIAIAFCLFVLCATFATAQQKRSRNEAFTIGPRLGLNYSTLVTQDPSVRSDYVLGYQAGAFMRVGLGKKSYLQPEMYFNSKGSSLSFQDAQGNGVKGTVRFSSVDVPVLIGRHLINGRHFKVRVLAGPMVSFNMRTNTQGLTEYNPSAYQFKDRIWGGQVGMGVDVGNVCVDARYETGFEKINTALGQRPSVFNLSVGFKLF